MNKNIGLTMLMEKIKNKQKLKLDLENGIILDLIWKEDIKAYQSYSSEIEMEVGLWLPETLIKIATEKDWGCKLIMED